MSSIFLVLHAGYTQYPREEMRIFDNGRAADAFADVLEKRNQWPDTLVLAFHTPGRSRAAKPPGGGILKLPLHVVSPDPEDCGGFSAVAVFADGDKARKYRKTLSSWLNVETSVALFTAFDAPPATEESWGVGD